MFTAQISDILICILMLEPKYKVQFDGICISDQRSKSAGKQPHVLTIVQRQPLNANHLPINNSGSAASFVSSLLGLAGRRFRPCKNNRSRIEKVRYVGKSETGGESRGEAAEFHFSHLWSISCFFSSRQSHLITFRGKETVLKGHDYSLTWEFIMKVLPPQNTLSFRLRICGYQQVSLVKSFAI